MSDLAIHYNNLEELSSVVENATSAELAAIYRQYFDRSPATKSRWFLIRRILWGYQSKGDTRLSEEATECANRLADEQRYRSRGNGISGSTKIGRKSTQTVECKTPGRAIPMPGSILTRVFKGASIRVLVLEDGFEWNGKRFGSISAVASEIAQTRWNGWRFFGLN